MAISCIESIKHSIPELTWKTLSRAGSTFLCEPFTLPLSDTTEPFYGHEMIRIVPGKRLVALGTWGGKEVVAKVFYERGKARQHLKRDVAGIEALVQSNVPTPHLLYQGSAVNRRMQVALFARVTGAQSLERVWQENKNSDAFVSLMRQVMIELATQHVLGILQCDLHFKNFLVTDYHRIYTLDGGGIKKFSTVLDKKQSMDSLSLFFAQLGAGANCLQRELFKVYAKARGWMIKPADFIVLDKAVACKNKERWQRYQKKIVRTCTAFVKITRWNQSGMYDRAYESEALLDFLKNPEKILAQPDVVFLKTGRSATVAKIKFGNQWLVVKRYNIKNQWHWLRRCLRATRAATAWRLAQRLLLFGVSTAKPVAYIEQRFCGLRAQSYLVMDYVAGQTIGEFFTGGETDTAQVTTMAGRVVHVLSQLSDLNMTHGDLKMTNILLANEYPMLIDLDGMREHKTKFGFKRAFKKEIERFMRNWEDCPKVLGLFRGLLKSENQVIYTHHT